MIPIESKVEPITKDSKIMNDLNEHLKAKYCLSYNKGYALYKEGTTYALYLHLNNSTMPMIIAGDYANDEEFTKYLIKSMDERRLFTVKYFQLYKTDKHGNV